MLEHIYITLLNNDYMEKLPNGIYNYEQYLEYVSRINELVIKTFENRIKKNITKKMKAYVQEKMYFVLNGVGDEWLYDAETISAPIEYKNLTYDKIEQYKIRKKLLTKKGFTMDYQKDEEIKYYNKAEIINLLVSKEPDIDVLDLNELEKQYFESYCELEIDMDEETKEMVEEVFKAFGVDK